MISMLLDHAAHLLGCKQPGTGRRFTGITTDSRETEAGMLFAALCGERSDGHDFAAEALAAGAAAVLVERPIESDGDQLVVDDVLAALAVLARAWRAEIKTAPEKTPSLQPPKVLYGARLDVLSDNRPEEDLLVLGSLGMEPVERGLVESVPVVRGLHAGRAGAGQTANGQVVIGKPLRRVPY